MNLGDALVALGVILLLVGAFTFGYGGAYYSRVSTTETGCSGTYFFRVLPGENSTIDLCEEELGSNTRGVLTVNINVTSNVTGGRAVLLVEENWSVVKRVVVSGARYFSMNVSGPTALNVRLILLSNPNTTVAYLEDHDITLRAATYKTASLRSVGLSLLAAGIAIAVVGALIGQRRRREPVEDMV